MRRFIWIWLTLLGALWTARTVIAAATFGRVEQRYDDLVQLVLVPAGQAAVLWWVTRESRTTVRQALRALLTPWLAVFFAWDAAVAALGWLLPESPFFTLLGGWNLAGLHNALQGLAGGAVVALSAVRGRWTSRERIWLALFALWLPAAGLSFLIPWLDGLPERLLPALPAALAWPAVYGALYVLSVGLILRIQLIWRARAAAPAWLLDLAVAFSLVSAALAVLNLARHPYLADPWSSLAHLGAYFAMTALFLGAYRAFGAERL
jgi:hypothetical protein